MCVSSSSSPVQKYTAGADVSASVMHVARLPSCREPCNCFQTFVGVGTEIARYDTDTCRVFLDSSIICLEIVVVCLVF